MKKNHQRENYLSSHAKVSGDLLLGIAVGMCRDVILLTSGRNTGKLLHDYLVVLQPVTYDAR